jgi:hypothetical protein
LKNIPPASGQEKRESGQNKMETGRNKFGNGQKKQGEHGFAASPHDTAPANGLSFYMEH